MKRVNENALTDIVRIRSNSSQCWNNQNSSIRTIFDTSNQNGRKKTKKCRTKNEFALSTMPHIYHKSNQIHAMCNIQAWNYKTIFRYTVSEKQLQ